MEERDKKKMDQLKRKLHTDDEGIIIILCTRSIFFLNLKCTVVDSVIY